MLANPHLLRARAFSGLEQLKTQTNVDSRRLAAVGYCFGGGVLLELARLGSDLAAVVAFHPGLTNLSSEEGRTITCKVMVCAGAERPLIPRDAREKFIDLIKASGADWQLLVYGNAGHSFTDRSVDALEMKSFFYHAPTDSCSWAAICNLLSETLGPA